MSATRPTVGEALRAAAARLAAAGNDTARLDAEVLLAALLGADRTALVVRRDEPLDATLERGLDALVARRLGGEPVAYLTGAKEFFSLALAVDPRVLIPRPETEELVEVVLRILDGLVAGAPPRAPLRVVDVGTGSGAIAVAVAHQSRRRWPHVRLCTIAVDRSADALAVARANAARHLPQGAIHFVQGDLTRALAARSTALVVANPPYLSDDELRVLSAEVAREPVAALSGGGKDGTKVLRELLADATRVLGPGGFLASEIGWLQGELVGALARDLGFEEVRVLPDLAGLDRILVARWRGESPST